MEKNIMSTAETEGLWTNDIEKSFQEALSIYPPCGRQKIMISSRDKMYGRNELIARHIFLKTGKIRTRKQVASHIQVLARKRMRLTTSKCRTPLIEGQHIIYSSANSSSEIKPSNMLSLNCGGTQFIGNNTIASNNPQKLDNFYLNDPNSYDHRMYSKHCLQNSLHQHYFNSMPYSAPLVHEEPPYKYGSCHKLHHRTPPIPIPKNHFSFPSHPVNADIHSAFASQDHIMSNESNDYDISPSTSLYTPSKLQQRSLYHPSYYKQQQNYSNLLTPENMWYQQHREAGGLMNTNKSPYQPTQVKTEIGETQNVNLDNILDLEPFKSPN